MLTEEHIKLAKGILKKQREGGDLSRWSFLSLKDTAITDEQEYVCVAGLNRVKQWKDEDKVLLFSFNGESPACGRGFAPYKGGELSKRWLEFLLGPQSPFPEVVKHIHNKDEIDEINAEGGFIFSPGYLEVGAGQLRGFLIASRYAQEQNDRAINWDLMVQHLKIDPLIAWVLSMSAAFTDGWIISTWSYSGHTVFYEPIGLYLPNLYKRHFPYDKILNEGHLSYCNSALYKMDNTNPAYVLYNNSWGANKDEMRDKVFLGVEAGLNVKQAEEKILAAINKVENEA